uniref:Uncharacterized protein n=1 Tax=Arundo donax TaxID=35708 RepID=A0A0A8ZYI0_ARUDO
MDGRIGGSSLTG